MRFASSANERARGLRRIGHWIRSQSERYADIFTVSTSVGEVSGSESPIGQ